MEMQLVFEVMMHLMSERVTVAITDGMCYTYYIIKRNGGETMQMCPNCERVYDESEHAKCPYCYGEYEDFGRERLVIVYDRDERRAKYVPASEAEKYNYKD